LKAVGFSVGGGVGLDDLEEGERGVGEAGLAAVDEAEFALDLKLLDTDADEGAGGELVFDGEAGDEGDAVAHLDEAFDGIEGGEFDSHVERGFVAAEGLDDLLALGRGDIVRDEVLGTELADGDFAGAGEGVLRVDDESELVAVDDDRLDLGIVGFEGEDADFDGVEEDFVGDAAGESALDGDFDVRVLAAVFVEQRQKIETGVLVGGEIEAAAVEGTELGEGAGGLVAEVEEFEGVVAKDFAGVGEGAVAGRAFEEDFTEFAFELGDGLTDGRLGAVQAGGGAGEAALFGDGEKGFELEEVHGVDPDEMRVRGCFGGVAGFIIMQLRMQGAERFAHSFRSIA
jgi:hypothetical protein